MVVDLIGKLVKSAKRVDLVIATVSDRRIDEASGLLASGLPDFWLLPVRSALVLGRTCGHQICCCVGSAGARRAG